MKYAGNALVKGKIEVMLFGFEGATRKVAAPIETEMARWSSG